MKAAVYMGTRNLYPRMIPAIKSLLYYSDVDKIYLMIEDDTFPYKVPEQVEVINVSNQKFFRKDGPNMNCYWTYFVLMRATLPHYFPDLDRILSLDVDTICTGNISDIWNLPIDDYYFAACSEYEKTADMGLLYTNMGVALYNLKKLRDGKADEIIKELNTHKHAFPEQDCFNFMCEGYVYEMPLKYNVASCMMHPPDTIFVKKPCIVHYPGIPDWTSYHPYKRFERMKWNQIKRNQD